MEDYQSKKKKKLKKPGPPTQRFLDIAEIRDDAVVLKDGTLRAVLMVSSVNFALKSRDEQQAMIQSYMQFLNGLEYPLQIVIQSRKMNIDRYIVALKEQEKTIPNELLKAQIRDYRSFIGELVELGEIMQKRFYVVVPYDPVTDKKTGFLSKLKTAVAPASVVKLNRKQFTDRRSELMQRSALVQSGLGGMGLQSVSLNTQGLIELYYTSYNPEIFDSQKLGDITKVRVEGEF
jgi:hypothetical protein